MTDSKKLLVAAIKKLAQTPTGGGGTDPASGDDLGGDIWTAPTAKPTPGGGGRGGGGGGGGPIFDMQKKMVQLGQQVQSHMKVEDIAKGESDPQAAGEAAGRDSFSDFMAKMMRGTQSGGGQAREFDPSGKATQMDQKKPSAPSRMWVLMDTIKRVGGPASEVKPDGVWGPRTNQALWNIRAFANALLQLSAAFEVPVKSYSQQNLEEFVLPKVDTEISPQDKAKSAPIISQHLDAIGEAWQEFKDGVLDNPHFQTYIEDDTPFATIGGPPKQPGQAQGQQPALIGPQEAQEINKYFPSFSINFTGPDGAPQTKTMSITPLITLQALEAWKKQNGVTMANRDILNQVRSQVILEPKPYEYTPPPASKKNRGMSGAVNVRASKR